MLVIHLYYHNFSLITCWECINFSLFVAAGNMKVREYDNFEISWQVYFVKTVILLLRESKIDFIRVNKHTLL